MDLERLSTKLLFGAISYMDATLAGEAVEFCLSGY